jgi:hypothetical protein
MKSSKNNIIFATVLGVVLSANPSISFSEKVKTDSVTATQVLAKGSEVAFSNYVKESYPGFSRKANWAVIEKMVTLYSNSPSQLLNTPSADRKAFNEAVKALTSKLNRQQGEAAGQWSRNLSKTAQQIQFIWNFDIDSLTPVVFETPVYRSTPDQSL